ncbi:MAG: 30S ribosomal protein S18 [Myxococcota bacterium]
MAMKGSYDYGEKPLVPKTRRRSKADPFESDKSLKIDYKDPETLKRFISERGKIIPSRISGVSAKNQRKLTLAIKRARHLALLPFSTSH